MVSLLVFITTLSPDKPAPLVLLFAPSSASNCGTGKVNYCDGLAVADQEWLTGRN